MAAITLPNFTTTAIVAAVTWKLVARHLTTSIPVEHVNVQHHVSTERILLVVLMSTRRVRLSTDLHIV
jgi:hypothetical protein